MTSTDQIETVIYTIAITLRDLHRRGYQMAPMEPVWEALSEHDVTMAVFAQAVRVMTSKGHVVVEDNTFRLTPAGETFAEETDAQAYRGEETHDARYSDEPVEQAREGGEQGGHQPAANDQSDPRSTLLPEGETLTAADLAAHLLVEDMFDNGLARIDTRGLLDRARAVYDSRGARGAPTKSARVLQHMIDHGMIVTLPGMGTRVTDSGRRVATLLASLLFVSEEDA